jgi:hypothetical protein
MTDLRTSDGPWYAGNHGKETRKDFVRGALEEPMFDKRQLIGPECNNGIRNRVLKER